MVTDLVILLLSLSIVFTISIAADTLTPNTPLADGDTLVSAGGTFVLGFFIPGGSRNRYIGIWYNKVQTQTVVWVANRQAPITSPGATLSISSGGALLVNDGNSTLTLSTPATNPTSPVAQLLDNGNFVVREAGGNDPNQDPAGFAWQSFDHPTDTLLPGMKLGWDLKRGLNRNLTAWTTASDPSPGPYSMAMDIRGDPELFLWGGSNPVWRSGPWDGLRFSGIPEMGTYQRFTFEFVNDANEVHYSYNIVNLSIITRLIVNTSGITQRLVWIDSSRSWNQFWFAPKDMCDAVSPCGPNGVCDPNGSPICSCLQGFEPRSPENWALRDGTGGCKRKTVLDCRNGTDGFVTLPGAKLPDTTTAAVNQTMGMDECRSACLSNCSCRAYASANISTATGCVTWSADLTDLRVYTTAGQDLFVRLAAADIGSSSEKSRKKGIAAAAIVIGGILCAILLSLVTCCVLREKKKKRRRKASMLVTVSFADNYHDQSAHGKDLELPLFDLVTIVVATDNFSITNKLGEGGFGPVYKGKLQDGQDIAVKRLAKTSLQGLDEFKNEVMLIAKLQHRNLVRLLGCCIDGEEKMLVYEYMYNTSLDAFLFDKAKSAMLDWDTRYKIILGIARGLLYLHQDSRLRIIHRDLKASNILLDKDMIPKISDFGMARIFGGDETEVNTRKVVGTYGYMSPEYAMDGIFSVKSDVFSFGVLLIEIISGRRNRGIYFSERQQNLLGHAWNLWKDGNALELVDESMSSSFSMTEAFRCLKVGLLCVQERPEDRPTMSSVVLMLGSEGTSLPPPKEPDFVATRGGILELMDSSTSKQADSMTLNDISVTMTEGR